jgi:hypothetical protein
VTFQVLTAASLKITVLECCAIESGGNYPTSTFQRCLLPLSRYHIVAALTFRINTLPPFSGRKMKTQYFAETLFCGTET